MRPCYYLVPIFFEIRLNYLFLVFLRKACLLTLLSSAKNVPNIVPFSRRITSLSSFLFAAVVTIVVFFHLLLLLFFFFFSVLVINMFMVVLRIFYKLVPIITVILYLKKNYKSTFLNEGVT